MKTIGKIFKWVLRIIGGAALLFVVLVGLTTIAWRASGRNLLPWQEPEIVEVEKVVEVQVPAECNCSECPECPEPVVCDECPECPAPVAGPVEPDDPAGPDTDLVEIGTGEAVAVGLKDPAANPVVMIEPGQGVLWSSDPGGANASGQVIDYETRGSMGYIFNDSDEPLEVVFHTGWNTENERWNISPVLFKVNDLGALREHTLTKNESEQKPMFFGLIWNGSELLNDPDI